MSKRYESSRSAAFVLAAMWTRIFVAISFTLVLLPRISHSAISLTATPTAPAVRLSWIEGEGSDLEVSWRTSASWGWSKGQLGLRVWIEVPRHVLSDSLANLNRNNQVRVVESNGPFRLRPGHVFIVTHMKSPSQWIGLGEESSPRLRALKIEARHEHTTWMRHPSCQTIAPFLTVRSETPPGPFFLALKCEKTSDPAKVALTLQVSEEANLTLRASSAAKLTKTGLIVSPPILAEKSSALLATIETRDLQGVRVAEFELRRPAQEKTFIVRDAPANESETERTDVFSIGLSGQWTELSHESESARLESGFQPLITLRWSHLSKYNHRTQAVLALPMAIFSPERFRSPSLTHFRVTTDASETPLEKGRLLLGAQVSRVLLNSTAPAVWISPQLGFRIGHEGEAQLNFLASPFALGTGTAGWGRLQTVLRLDSREFVRGANSRDGRVRAFAQFSTLRDFARGREGWGGMNVDLGIEGMF